MEVAEHVVGGGTLGRGCGAQCRHRPGPLGLPDGDDAHDQLCRQDCRVRHWGGLQPQLVFSVGKQAVSACLLWGGGGPTLAWKVIPKSVLHERSLLVKHAAFEGPAERDTVCLTA